MARVPLEAHEALYRAYLIDLKVRYPGLAIVRQSESRTFRAIDRALCVLTGGRHSGLTGLFITTLGRRIYVPDDWDTWPAGQRYCILRHEAVHVGQFDRLGWPAMVLIYLFLPLPAGFAAGRTWLEWQGYRETWIATWQVYGREAAHDPRMTADIVQCFTGSDYVWMWVRAKSIVRKIDGLLAELERRPPPSVYEEGPVGVQG